MTTASEAKQVTLACVAGLMVLLAIAVVGHALYEALEQSLMLLVRLAGVAMGPS